MTHVPLAAARILVCGLLAPSAWAADSFSTLFGGGKADTGTSAGIDSAGNIYVAGSTTSPDLPIIAAPFAMSPPVPRTCYISTVRSYDCPEATGFVAKISPDGSRVLYSAYFAGTGSINGLAVAPDGSAYITGVTNSTAFPVTPQAYRTQPRRLPSGFVTKIAADGSSLVYSTFVDGTPYAIAIDGKGSAAIAGSTDSDIATTPNAVQSQRKGGLDGFVSVLNPAGSALSFSTYLGGSNDDEITTMAMDPAGDLAIAGHTQSDDFPTTPGVLELENHATPFQTSAFVSKVDPATGTLMFSSFFLTGYQTSIGAITTDSASHEYLTGAVSLPGVPSAIGSYQGSGDAFAAKVDPAGTRLEYFTYIGGTAGDAGAGIATDSASRAFVVGTSSSHEFDVPGKLIAPGGTCRTIAAYGGPDFFRCANGFLVELKADGTPVYTRFLGGSENDYANAIVLDAKDNAYVAGATRSENFTSDAAVFQDTRSPGNCSTVVALLSAPGKTILDYPCPDAFVAKVSFPPVAPTQPALVNAASYEGQPISPGTLVSLFGSGLGPATGVQAMLDEDGRIPTSLGGTQVLIDGAPAPVLYAQDKQVNVVVPFGTPTSGLAQVQVQAGGQTIDAGLWRLGSTSPGLFASDSSGSGQSAVLNQDQSRNTPANPAAKGTIISLFLTGGGMTQPPPVDGELAGLNPPLLAAPVAVWFATGNYLSPMASGEITYSGAAPTLVYGVVQINVRIPDGAISGDSVQLFVEIDGSLSQVGATVAVQ